MGMAACRFVSYSSSIKWVEGDGLKCVYEKHRIDGYAIHNRQRLNGGRKKSINNLSVVSEWY
jgi:hypothetical protein